MVEPWTVRGQKVVLEDRWVRVRADVCVTGRGRELNPYYIFEYPVWVNVFALTGNDSVLLIRQYRHGCGEISLELPGGVMEETDADPAATAVRELLEETGYFAHSMTQYLQCSPNGATHNNVQYSFLARDLEYRGGRNVDENEDLEVVATPVGEACDLALSGQVVQGLHVAAILAACMRPEVKPAMVRTRGRVKE